MEKIIYALWYDAGADRDQLNERVKNEIAGKLSEHALSVRVNIQDESVAGGSSPRLVSTRPQMDAVIQLWVHTAHDPQRQPIDEIIGSVSGRHAAWLVSEATILPNVDHTPTIGDRTYGFSQMVFLGLPPRLTPNGWREAWHKLHTPVAVVTQSNFEYIQNLVIRPLTYGAPDYVAIVEECFPPEALNDEAAFYDAVGNPAKLAENQQAMMESCGRFMDFDRVDCIPTSQFDIKTLSQRG